MIYGFWSERCQQCTTVHEKVLNILGFSSKRITIDLVVTVSQTFHPEWLRKVLLLDKSLCVSEFVFDYRSFWSAPTAVLAEIKHNRKLFSCPLKEQINLSQIELCQEASQELKTSLILHIFTVFFLRKWENNLFNYLDSFPGVDKCCGVKVTVLPGGKLSIAPGNKSQTEAVKLRFISIALDQISFPYQPIIWF